MRRTNKSKKNTTGKKVDSGGRVGEKKLCDRQFENENMRSTGRRTTESEENTTSKKVDSGSRVGEETLLCPV